MFLDRRCAVSCLILVLGLGVCANLVLGQQISKSARDASENMLESISSDIRKHYYDPNLHGINWDQTVSETKQKIEKAPSYDMALAYITDALNRLNDSHTFMFPPRRNFRYEYGWQYSMVGNECFVTHVRPGTDAEKKGLHPGDRVTSISGYVPRRSNLWEAQYMFGLLHPVPELQLDLVDPTGTKKHLVVEAKVRPTPQLTPFEETAAEIRDEETESYFGRIRFAAVDGNVLIVKFPEFAFSKLEVQGVFDKARDHQGLVLDLRGNPGGNEETMRDMVSGLFDHEVKIADRVMRSNRNTLTASPLHHVFGGKLVVLVDSSSAFAAELLARVVQLEKRGSVIGDRSSGAVMESRPYQYEIVGTGIYYGAFITHADLIMTDGKSLEHVGVTPDEVMLPTADDLAQGRDPVLAHAVEALGGNISPETAGKLFPYEWAPE